MPNISHLLRSPRHPKALRLSQSTLTPTRVAQTAKICHRARDRSLLHSSHKLTDQRTLTNCKGGQWSPAHRSPPSPPYISRPIVTSFRLSTLTITSQNDNTTDNTRRPFTSQPLATSQQTMSSSNNTRISPSGGNGSGSNNNERPRLTDAEKKQNHIISEQKRRQAIRQGFDRLAAMTPGMNGMGRSEAAVLNAAVGEIKKQTDIKDRLKRKLMRENPDITSEWFEAFYAEGLATQPGHSSAAAPASNNVSSPNGSAVNSTGSASKGKTTKRVKKET